MRTLYFFDNQFPNNGHTHTRKVVRAVVYNQNHQIALIKLYGDDSFGHRDYYETPGGGINKGEKRMTALSREIEEEIGYRIKNVHFIARVIDYYNLIKRRNDNYFYICQVGEFIGAHLEEYEKRIFNSVEWYSIDDAIEIYRNTVKTPISTLVIQRELPILLLAKEYLENIK